MSNHDALLEIGTEEIPAKMAPRIHSEIDSVTEKTLQKYRIVYKEIQVLGAPRRLAILINNLQDYQQKLVEEIKGPPCNISFDQEGNPTRAVEGFASNQGVDVQDLEVRETDKGQYMYAVVEREKKPVRDLLPDIFKDIITSIKFSNSMRWGNQQFNFIRPIHWLCALYDNQLIKFSIAGIETSSDSRGHRFLAPDFIKIERPAKYIENLRDNYVIVDPAERKNIILEGIKELEQKENCKVIIDNKLLKEVIHLIEFPTPFLGEFSKEYLDLPEEIIITTTREHQRYFITREEELLKNNFVGVRDGSDENILSVIEGNQKVLKARFDDADFYYKIDLDKSNEDRVEELEGLIFREELGSMYDKIKRIEKIISWLGNNIKIKTEIIDNTLRAAYLCKSDLVSYLVREFPELQGTMGSIYAEKEGENKQVVRAIREHYQPEFADDLLPSSSAGKLLSLADKLDTLCASFAIGLIPTGSEDPYGLRRAATGIIRLLESLKISLSLKKLARRSCELIENVKISEKQIIDIQNFLKERLRYILEENRGFSHDIVRAALGGLNNDIPGIIDCVKNLDEIKQEQKFEEVVTTFKRVESIVSGFSKKNAIKTNLLLEKKEQNLYNMYWQVNETLKNMPAFNYSKAYEQFKMLVDPVNEFFDAVKVMSDNDEIRQNRLNLLQAILEQFLLIGDLSKIVLE